MIYLSSESIVSAPGRLNFRVSEDLIITKNDHPHFSNEVESTLQICGFHIHGFNQGGSKIFFKNSRKFQKAKLNLPPSSNYLHSIYLVLGIISNLEMISSIWEDVLS